MIDMRGVDYVNQLYGGEEIRALQRRDGRFINAALKVSVAGAITADALEDHRIISGPGGQYNFVSMAHALKDARSITMLRSVRGFGRKAKSNIVWQYAHTTIPRHLRDIVITEYGIADLRGRRDKEVIMSLLNITDSRFQNELLEKAKKFKKIEQDYEIPKEYRNNYPKAIEEKFKKFVERGFFKPFPFGTDLTEEEVVIGKALKGLKEKAAENVYKLAYSVLREIPKKIPSCASQYLERMELASPKSIKEKLLQKVVLSSLRNSGAI